MKRSSFIIPTLKENPADAQIVSHALMLRAGMIRKTGAGFYTYLPLGLKVLRKVEEVIREEMNRSGAQEMLFPLMISRQLWDQTGRWDVFKKELFRLHDRHGGDYALGPTHEEAFTAFLKSEISSYRDLPLTLYQIGTKFRDEIRPRYGVMRSKEFLMKDAYSFHTDNHSLHETYEKMRQVYTRIFDRLGLRYAHVKADSGSMGGSDSEEFMVKSAVGEETIITCSQCGYAANRETAQERLKAPEPKSGGLLKKVPTPGTKTIESVSQLLKVPVQQSIKAMIYHVRQAKDQARSVMVLIRGDYQVNEAKIARLFAGCEIRKATDEEIAENIKAPPGFIGPVGIENVEIIVDETLRGVKNTVCGANEEDFHYMHVDIDRDFVPDRYADIYLAREGQACPDCGSILDLFKGIEVGHIFKLGDKYCRALGLDVLDAESKRIIPTMGCYGIGVNRTLASIIEQNHDQDGIVWPPETSPFAVMIITVNQKDRRSKEYAAKLYQDLTNSGIETLWDDTEERAGFKFKDADLLGIPLQAVVGPRGLAENLLEIKWRHDKGSKKTIPADKAVEIIMHAIMERK